MLRELGRAAGDSIASGRSDQFSMEMATAMLFVEHGLDQVRQLPEDFADHAEVVGARLLALAAGETPPDAPQWQGDLSRQIAQGQTVAVLAAEMKTGLRQVEKVLDDYYADASRRPALAGIDPLLHQLQGALAILDQDQAVQAAQHIRDQVKHLAAGLDAPAAAAEAVAAALLAAEDAEDAAAPDAPPALSPSAPPSGPASSRSGGTKPGGSRSQ